MTIMATALESEFKNLSLQEDSIKPGLFHLSLNLLYQPDSDTLNERKKLLYIQLKEEHPTCHPILKNLIALVNHRLPRRQIKVIDILERIEKENPNHLNTLANLEVVYKELHRHNEADRCKQEKDALLCRNDREAKTLKAQCVLEQAYSLIIEETTNHEGIANHRLRDSLKILSSEHERSSAERQEYLGKALRYTEQASSCVLNAMYCDRPDEKLQRKKDAIEKFLQGLKMLESIGKQNTIEYHIWMFCYGMALNKYDFSISENEDESERQIIRKALLTQSLQVFWRTICNLKPTDKTGLYIARSYAYIGHILISRKDIVDDIVKSNTIPVDQQSQWMNLFRNPFNCFQVARKLRPKDVHVLNRFGRSLKNKANFESWHDANKMKTLLEAYDWLTLSIKTLPHNNWFAYVTRMETCRDLALLSWNHRDVTEWLEYARLDGIACFYSKATDKHLCTLAKVCQMLAKNPNVKKYGSKFVKNRRYIHEAIFYLNYALQLGGFVNYLVVYTLASCLYEIQEHRTAIEWMKRAMHLGRKSSKSDSLTRIAQYILELRAKLAEGDTSTNYLFNEMYFWIGQGKAKFHDISHSISDLCKYHADGMIDFIKYMLNNNQSNSESTRDLISSCLKALRHWQGTTCRYQKSLQECEEKLKVLLSPAITVKPDSKRSDQYTTPDIVMPFSIDAKKQHSKFMYDFFVSHSNVNRDWVNNYLLHQLETKLHDNDTAFKGCIADRDFTLGSTIISNIRAAVEHSCKIIFVITEDFIKSRWCDFEVDQALVEMLSTKKEDCLIPILLGKIDDQRFPKKLAHITYLDLTDESKHLQEVMKLKTALSIQFD